MSNYKYLDDNGLTYYHSKVKALLANKVDKVTGKGLSTNDYTTTEKNKLAAIASGAEVNQNAFSNIVVGSSTIAADAKTDTLTITAGSNITLTPNTANDSLTIAATDTTYSDATTSTHGLMSAADKVLLNKVDSLVEGGTPAFDNISEWTASGSYGYLQWVTHNNHIYRCDADPATTGTFVASEWLEYNLIALSVDTRDQFDMLFNDYNDNIIAINDALDTKAPKASPTFTGTPKAPTASAGTNTTQIATTAFVKTAVDNAVAGITGIEFQIVASLPATGRTGTIYLVSNGGANPNSYDEYIWITSTSKFEKIGTTDVDLSGYVQASQMVAITNAEIDTIVA